MQSILTLIINRSLQRFNLETLFHISSRLEVTTAHPDRLKPKPEVKNLVFGKTFTDHLLRATWTASGGWGPPRITPFENFSIHPAAKALHYAQVCDNSQLYETYH